MKQPAPSQHVALIRMSKIYESLRYNDYDAENGLGEIVDNSIEARAANIHVDLTLEKVKKPDKKKPADTITRITVTDDGCGMDRDTLYRCLVLGESIRPARDGQLGIGRFGVGMTLGSISLARRVEVYSRSDGSQPFQYTYIDLDDIRDKDVEEIPVPVEKDPPHAERLAGKSGTVVVLDRCDRLGGTGEGFANYLGRTYRKFIQRGVQIFLNGSLVYLHDPLYMAGPTRFDAERMEQEGVPDLKAEPLGSETRISLPVPGQEGQMADVVIRMSLLPKEWRTEIGDGGNKFSQARKIDQNEGVSILRADREVFYDTVPYITGPKGESKSLRIDRWWGCEISFPPELDSYFQVRYIKRGVEPVSSVRNQIRNEIYRTVRDARERIRQDREAAHAELAIKRGIYEAAESVMSQTDHILPRGPRGRDLTSDENEQKLDQLLSAGPGGDGDTAEEKAAKEEALRRKPYAIPPVSWPATFPLFFFFYLLNSIVIQLNVNHPFYEAILAPLCGESEDAEFRYGVRRETIKTAILLLLFSYAKAESMFDGNKDNLTLFKNLRLQWGSVLAAALEEYQREEGETT